MAVPPEFHSPPAGLPTLETHVPGAPDGPAPDTQTRERLLKAAIAVFDRKGYAAASIREIVERAGVTKPALYYHFGSKEGLLGAVLQEGERHLRDIAARALARSGTARERIVAFAEDLYLQIQDNQASMRLVHSLFFSPVEAAPRFDFGAFDHTLVGAVQAIVEDGAAAGECVAQPRDVAIAIMGVIGACAGRQLHPGLEPVSIDSLPRILGLVLDGVLRPPTPGEPRS
jgi:AcrR family transcriptional regulator